MQTDRLPGRGPSPLAGAPHGVAVQGVGVVTTAKGPVKRLSPARDTWTPATRLMPDPEPLIGFGEAVKSRKRAGGHAEAAHRTATLFHLANISIRTGRKLRYDPVKEEIIGDEEANRLVYQPMLAPWHLI